MKQGGKTLPFKDMFSKNKKKYARIPAASAKSDVPVGIMTKCPECKKTMFTNELEKNLKVCLHCGHHFPLHAEERLTFVLDENSFEELDTDLETVNPLDFPGYIEKVEKDKVKAKINEAVVTGVGTIDNRKIVIAIMDSHFRMGSMGSVVGEKIKRAVEKADELHVPFIIFTASGGARMQEGMLSLMQMAKTSAALKRFSDNGGLIISVMTHPTTGGVSASFASLGDYNLAEPGALIGFSGRRIIEQTIHEKLPDDFQTAEFQLQHGQLDSIVHRSKMKEKLSLIVELHTIGGDR